MCTDKKTLRGRYLAERASLSAEEKQAIDRGIAQNILQSEFYQQADCIFCYVSTAEEIDTRTVLENALASGRTVCVPLCGKGGSMTARKITALSELQTGHYGILEPSDTAPEIAPENIASMQARSVRVCSICSPAVCSASAGSWILSKSPPENLRIRTAT